MPPTENAVVLEPYTYPILIHHFNPLRHQTWANLTIADKLLQRSSNRTSSNHIAHQAH